MINFTLLNACTVDGVISSPYKPDIKFMAIKAESGWVLSVDVRYKDTFENFDGVIQYLSTLQGA